MTSKSCNVLLAVVIIVALTVTVAYGAEVATNTQFASVTLEAKDVNCADCHTENPHIIHKQGLDAGKVTCEACHGESFEIGIPKCTKCHNGPIHEAHHISKGADCTTCHAGDLDNVHYDLFGGKELVCAHCHGDIIAVHGEGMSSCEKCHKSAPDIVVPTKSAGMTIMCQTCHNYDDAASIHGDLSDPTGCYKCHRTAPNSTPAEIPHNLHIPLGVTCDACHLTSDTKISIPQCSKCHNAVDIHLLSKIGISTTGAVCSVCHGTPPEKVAPETPTAVATQTESGPVEDEATPAGKNIPGFEGALAVTALVITMYWRRRNE
ncbi:MAG: cytochrome c3 family protein [Euryarchaeota archaeon]|nr:cytochrome c3 family protein [Euryarchaeota archaeon]